MKKTMLVSAIVIAVVFGSMPIFAQRGMQSQRVPNFAPNNAPNQSWGYNNAQRGGGFGGGYGEHAYGGMMGGCFGGRGNNSAENIKIGTVSAVDAKTGVITVTDSDGKAFKVSVNPATVIFDSTEALAARNAWRTNPNITAPAQVVPKVLTVAEVKTGDWVEIRYFNTGTATIDAARIQLIKK